MIRLMLVVLYIGCCEGICLSADSLLEKVRLSSVALKDVPPISKEQKAKVEEHLTELELFSLSIDRWQCSIQGTRSLAYQDESKQSIVRMDRLRQYWAVDNINDFEKKSSNVNLVFLDNGAKSLSGANASDGSAGFGEYLRRGEKGYGFVSGKRVKGDMANIANRQVDGGGIVFPVRLAETTASEAYKGDCNKLNQSFLKIRNAIGLKEKNGFEVCLFEFKPSVYITYYRLVWFHEGCPMRVDDYLGVSAKDDTSIGSGDTGEITEKSLKTRNSAKLKARTITSWQDILGTRFPVKIHSVNLQGPVEIEYDLSCEWKVNKQVSDSVFSIESLAGVGEFREGKLPGSAE